MMNDDLIKRSDAIRAITNHCENECYYRGDNWCPQCQREEFEETINAIPSADRPQGWIPCSERLPERDGNYLATLHHKWPDREYKTVEVEEFRSGGFDENLYVKVVAWMPLPKPWKERSK